MPLTDIQIEQVSPTDWVARIEVGGMVCKRTTVRADTFGAVVSAVCDGYRELIGEPAPATARVPSMRDRSGMR